MAELEWDDVTDRHYNYGVDRGVFYLDNYQAFPWNGLISVKDSLVGPDVESLHYDGIKYLDFYPLKNYQATIKAFTAPKEFASCEGDVSVIPGFILTRQPRTRFGFSYRVMASNEDYEIHVVYNCIVNGSRRSYKSVAESITPSNFEWKLDATPPINTVNFAPSPHIIIKSKTADPGFLDLVESYLYGAPGQMAMLPPFDVLIEWSAAEFFGVEQDWVTGFNPLISGGSDLYTSNNPGLLRRLPDSRLIPTSLEGIYGLE